MVSGTKREVVRVRSRHTGIRGRDENIRRCSRSQMFHDDEVELVFHVEQRAVDLELLMFHAERRTQAPDTPM